MLVSVDKDDLNKKNIIWDKLSVKNLQNNSQVELTNFERTNKKFKQIERERKRKEKKKKDATFSKALLTKLGINGKSKNWGPERARLYHMAKGMAGDEVMVDGDNANEGISDRQLTKLKLIDWKKSLIKKNVDAGHTEFNGKSDPRAMRSDQVLYCINLMRYCSKDFED